MLLRPRLPLPGIRPAGCAALLVAGMPARTLRSGDGAAPDASGRPYRGAQPADGLPAAAGGSASASAPAAPLSGASKRPAAAADRARDASAAQAGKLDPRQLTAAIQRAATLPQLQALYAQHQGCLNAIHAAALASRAVKLAASGGDDEPAAAARRGEGQLWEGSRGRQAVLGGPQRIRQPAQQPEAAKLMALLLDHCEQQQVLPSLRPRELSTLLWAAAKLGCSMSDQRQAAWLEQLLLCQEEVSTQDVSLVLWSLATAQAQPPPVLVTRLLRLLSHRWRAASPQSLSNVLWACAKLNAALDDSSLAAFYAASAPKLPEFSSQALANSLWALAQYQAAPPAPWLSACLAQLQALLPTMAHGHLASVLWSLAAMGAPLPPRLHAQLLGACQPRMHLFSTQDLANIIWAQAVMQQAAAAQEARAHQPSRSRVRQEETGRGTPAPAALSSGWLDSFMATSQPCLYAFSSQELSATLWSLATLRARPSGLYLNAFYSALQPKLAGCSPQSLANTLWALAKLDAVPVSSRRRLSSRRRFNFPLFFRALARHVAACGPAELAAVVWSLGRMRRRPPRYLLEEILVGSYKKAGYFTALEISMLLWGLVKLRVRPVPVWMGRLLLQLDACGDEANHKILSKILWSLGFHIGPGARRPRKLIDALLSAAIASSADIRPAEAAVSLTGLAWLRQPPPDDWLHAALGSCAAQLQGAAPLDVAAIAWALAKLRLAPSQSWWRALVACLSEPSQLAAYEPRQLSKVIWAAGQLAEVGCQGSAAARLPPALLQQLAQRLRALRGRCNPQELVNAASGLAKLGAPVDAAWLQDYCAAVDAKLPSFQGYDLAYCLWAVATLAGADAAVDPAWLERMALEMHVKLTPGRAGAGGRNCRTKSFGVWSVRAAVARLARLQPGAVLPSTLDSLACLAEMVSYSHSSAASGGSAGTSSRDGDIGEPSLQEAPTKRQRRSRRALWQSKLPRVHKRRRSSMVATLIEGPSLPVGPST